MLYLDETLLLVNNIKANKLDARESVLGLQFP